MFVQNTKKIIKKIICSIISIILGISILLGINYYNNKKLEQLSFYEKLAKGASVSILVIGDSIGAGTNEVSWAGQLSAWLERTYQVKVALKNISMGGNTSYAGYVSTMNLHDDVDYDLAIICYGQNDGNEDFSLYYETIYRAITYKYEKCSVISILEHSQRGYTNKMNVIQELALHYQVDVADTIAAFENSDYTYDELVSDGVHLNAQGKTIYFETVQEIIEQNIFNQTLPSSEALDPVNENAILFDSFRFLDVSQFERVDDVTYSAKVNCEHGALGIYYRFYPGDNGVDIFVDDKLLISKNRTFNYDFQQDRIELIGNDISAVESIELVFLTKEQADGFKGVALSEEH